MRLATLTSSSHALKYDVSGCKENLWPSLRCSAWFCPTGTSAGYPEYGYRNGPEYGYLNLALFFYGCNRRRDKSTFSLVGRRNVSKGLARREIVLLRQVKGSLAGLLSSYA
jgi:hypothetical protein